MDLPHRSKGSPVLPLGQEQIAWPFLFSHTAFAPQGDGSHGSVDDKYNIQYPFLNIFKEQFISTCY